MGGLWTCSEVKFRVFLFSCCLVWLNTCLVLVQRLFHAFCFTLLLSGHSALFFSFCQSSGALFPFLSFDKVMEKCRLIWKQSSEGRKMAPWSKRLPCSLRPRFLPPSPICLHLSVLVRWSNISGSPSIYSFSVFSSVLFSCLWKGF